MRNCVTIKGNSITYSFSNIIWYSSKSGDVESEMIKKLLTEHDCNPTNINVCYTDSSTDYVFGCDVVCTILMPKEEILLMKLKGINKGVINIITEGCVEGKRNFRDVLLVMHSNRLLLNASRNKAGLTRKP